MNKLWLAPSNEMNCPLKPHEIPCESSLKPCTAPTCTVITTLLPQKIIHQPRPLHLPPLPDNNMPRIKPLLADHLKPPNLIRAPAITDALRISLHPLPTILVQPPFQKELQILLIIFTLTKRFAELGFVGPARLAEDFAEDAVLVLAHGPVERALFGRAAEAAGGDLRDVDVGCAGGVGGLGDGEGDGGQGDGFAG